MSRVTARARRPRRRGADVRRPTGQPVLAADARRVRPRPRRGRGGSAACPARARRGEDRLRRRRRLAVQGARRRRPTPRPSTTACSSCPSGSPRLDVPTFFAAHALTLTWAFEVALACDILLAAEKAKFGLVERVIGLTPTMGGTQRLASRAGVARAKELVFTGELYDATTLERWNVVNRVLPDDGFDDAVTAIVHQVAVGPTQGVRRGQADPAPPRGRRPAGGARPHHRHRVRAVRHRRPPARHGVLPHRRPRQGDVHRSE